MCGIVGFVGDSEAAPIILSALTKLEYRGYDSAGLAMIVNGQVRGKKDAGRIAEVREKHQLDNLAGRIGIGHVRWPLMVRLAPEMPTLTSTVKGRLL